MLKTTINYSSRKLTVKESIRVKDTLNAIRLDEIAKAGDQTPIPVDYFAVLDILNDQAPADQQYYQKIVVASKDGDYYITGSQSFLRAIKDINDAVIEAGESDYSIIVNSHKSKNYSGYFLTCTIA